MRRRCVVETPNHVNVSRWQTKPLEGMESRRSSLGARLDTERRAAALVTAPGQAECMCCHPCAVKPMNERTNECMHFSIAKVD